MRIATRSSRSIIATSVSATKNCASLRRKAGLKVLSCERVTRERRPPHFEVLSLLARNERTSA